MSMDQNTEKTKTLAGLAAEALDSETLMADTGSVPVHVLLDKAPRVSQVDHQLNVNGNADTGATTGPVVATGNKFNGDGISLLVEVHRSLENVDGSLKECGSKGMNGEENGAEQTETEMVDAVDGGKDVERSGTERGSQGTEEEQGSGHLFKGMNVEENETEKMENEMVDGGTEDDNSGEDARSVKHVYTVGDFVWGKIKSHPWWPGRIYDASCASDFALKFSQTGRLLVAYFGDGSFSWCPPAQLVPFVDNFEKMSKQSASKSFLYAVEKALDEISVLVEFGMTCQCISEESRCGLSWPLAVNAGIKKGVRLPEGETVRLLLSQYEPAGILKVLKHYARTNSNSNILEFAVLKSWLSAFYRATCGCPLALYCEPLQVEGLEDKKDQVVDANDFSIPIEVPILGPSEEETPKSGPAKGPLTACDKISHKRKQKSVAELMEDSTPSPVETPEKKRRRKSGEQAKGHTSSSKSVDEKVGKRVGNKPGDTDLAKTKNLSVSIPERDEIGDQQDTNGGPLSRERKKSKYLSPPYMSPTLTAGKPNLKRELEAESQKISEITRIGERMANAARHILSSPATNGNEAVKKKKAERFDMTFDTMDIDSVDEVLSEVQSTAVNPLFLKNRSLEKTRGFISTFRNSVYLDGSNYKQYHKVKTGKKRKSRPSSQGTVDEEAGTETSPVILMVTFSAGFSLPSDDEVIQIYNKFGDLNEKETKVLHDSNSVQVVYMRGSDAEEAFQESVKQSPFGATQVNFRIIYPSNSEIPLSSLRSAKGKSQVQLIKQKLKGMSSILEKCNGKITTEEKAELEGEIKGLLEKVSAVTSTNP
ncbi:PWWP domain-containing protein 6 [Nicotiana tomentosiformis]|uniref:PWWP domain-containing protein 6 n=1 Tax=Nicotiana tomentosiformis TaxID=4098 RepID=UPI00051B891A|nr:uncharacterized protein LOC104110833 [Nicotiana tomentosiformis]